METEGFQDSSEMRFAEIFRSHSLWTIAYVCSRRSHRLYAATPQACRLYAVMQLPGDVTSHAQEVFRKAALEQLKARVQGSLTRANVAATADMDRLLEQQAELTQRDREVSAGVVSVQVSHACMPCISDQCHVSILLCSPCQGAPLMLLLCIRLQFSCCLQDGMSCGVQAERHALEACVLEMAGKSAALERWLADNEKKAVTGAPCLSQSCLNFLSLQALPCMFPHLCAQSGLSRVLLEEQNLSSPQDCHCSKPVELKT